MVRQAIAVLSILLLPLSAFAQSADDGVVRTGQLAAATSREMAQNWALDAAVGASTQQSPGPTSARFEASFVRNCRCGTADITRVRFVAQAGVENGAVSERVAGASVALDAAASFNAWASLQSTLRLAAFDHFVRSPREGVKPRHLAGATITWTRAFAAPAGDGQWTVFGGAGRSFEDDAGRASLDGNGVWLAGAAADLPVTAKLTVRVSHSYLRGISSPRHRLGATASVSAAFSRMLGATVRYAVDREPRSPARGRSTAGALTVAITVRLRSKWPVYLI